MPQPERQARVDSYGKPLPELADVQQRVTLEMSGNQARLSLWHALVEETARAVCRRGWHGTVAIRLHVEDGMLQRDLYASLERVWRDQREL